MSEHPVVWTWKTEEGLCYVTHRDPKMMGQKPSPEAVKVRVRLVPLADYERLPALLAEQGGAGDAATYGAWKAAALRVGEELASTGPDGYYEFGPSVWREWALSALASRPAPLPASDGVREFVERAAAGPCWMNRGGMTECAEAFMPKGERHPREFCLRCHARHVLAALARGGGA